jgi:hypothetical protein
MEFFDWIEAMSIRIMKNVTTATPKLTTAALTGAYRPAAGMVFNAST